jgi:hypothetical protein
MCEDFIPSFGNNRTGCRITTTHHLTLPFSPGNFLPKTIGLLSPTGMNDIEVSSSKMETEKPRQFLILRSAVYNQFNSPQ